MLEATIDGHHVLARFLVVDRGEEFPLQTRLLRHRGEHLLAVWLLLMQIFCVLGATSIVKVESCVVEGLGEAAGRAFDAAAVD